MTLEYNYINNYTIYTIFNIPFFSSPVKLVKMTHAVLLTKGRYVYILFLKYTTLTVLYYTGHATEPNFNGEKLVQ